MATRFYLETSAHPIAVPVTPAFSGSWDVSGQAVRRWMVTGANVYPTNLADSGQFDEASASAVNVLAYQFVSAPLAAATIAGTLKGQIVVDESNAANDMRAQVVLRVVSHDGSSVTGTLLAADASALSSEFSTGQVSRKFPLAAISPASLSSLAVNDGDRLVLEVGYRAHNVSGSSVYARFQTGSNHTTDLPENETNGSGTGRAWFEFSDTLAFLADDEALGLGLHATEEYVEAVIEGEPSLHVTEVYAEVSFDRDYVYLDGTIVVDDAQYFD